MPREREQGFHRIVNSFRVGVEYALATDDFTPARLDAFDLGVDRRVGFSVGLLTFTGSSAGVAALVWSSRPRRCRRHQPNSRLALTPC
jgi:hypothetical protein